MKRGQIFILFIFVFVINGVCAAPQITSAPSSISHGQTITINGNNFGIKDGGSSPYYWNDGEDKTTGSCSILVSDFNYTDTADSCNWWPGDNEKDLQYATESLTGMDGPHQYSTKYITHVTQNTNDGLNAVGSGQAMSVRNPSPAGPPY